MTTCRSGGHVKILALVTAQPQRTHCSVNPDANITYLQRMARYSLVCKKWNGLLWQNHPREISCAIKASSPVVKLLHKIPFLSKLKIMVRYTTVQRDLDIFIDSLLAPTGATSFAAVLQHLEKLSLVNTFQSDNLKKIQSIFANHARDHDSLHETSYAEWNDMRYDLLFGFESKFARTGRLDDDCDWMFPVTKEKCTLQRFSVRFPECMKLVCTQIVPPQDILNVAIVQIRQPSDVTGEELKGLKRARFLQSFQCNSMGLEGCTVGTRLRADKLLQNLPPSLLELNLECSPEFILPTRCQWPPVLQKLLISSIQLSAPSAGQLPDSLHHIGIDFSKACCEDGVAYPFENFDMSSLPRGLRTLELYGLVSGNEWSMGGKKLIKIIGTPPPSLHTVLTDNEDAIDRHSFSPSCNFGRGKKW